MSIVDNNPTFYNQRR